MEYNNNLELLTRIYNTLLLVNTKGEDTMIMGECLRALQNYILTEQQINKQPDNEKEE